MSQLLNKLKTKSPDELRARLEVITLTAAELLKVWNRPLKEASFFLEIANPADAKYPRFLITWAGSEVPDSFREFIHNFCTELCGEKLAIEGLLTDK